jgi:hypothetical protein
MIEIEIGEIVGSVIFCAAAIAVQVFMARLGEERAARFARGCGLVGGLLAGVGSGVGFALLNRTDRHGAVGIKLACSGVVMFGLVCLLTGVAFSRLVHAPRVRGMTVLAAICISALFALGGAEMAATVMGVGILFGVPAMFWALFVLIRGAIRRPRRPPS